MKMLNRFHIVQNNEYYGIKLDGLLIDCMFKSVYIETFIYYSNPPIRLIEYHPLSTNIEKAFEFRAAFAGRNSDAIKL